MKGMEFFRIKSPEELKNQVDSVSNTIESGVVPPSNKEEVLDLPIEEIKKRHPTRYEIYLNVLRKQKNNVEIDEKEREEMSDWLESLNNLDKYIENYKADKNERTLQEKQFTVFEDLRKFVEEGGKEAYIKLPTGSGKTVIFSEFIEAFNQKTLIVVPTQLLIHQTEKELNKFAEDTDVGKVYAYAKEHNKDVVITTYDSLVSQLKKGSINPEDYKLLILDEVHQSLSEKRIEAVNRFDKALKIGFTATPTYSPEKKVNQLLNNEIHNLGVREAAEEGILSPFSVILAKTNIDLSNISITSNGEYDEKELEKAVNKEARNKSAVDLYKEMFNGQLAVAYCVDVNHAKEVARLFNENGIPADYVSGERQDPKILERFSRGEIKVLCNAKLLIAGFNEPKVSVCLNLKPTLSRVDAEQRGGRTLRLDKDNPEKHASIVDLIDETHKNPPVTFAEIAGTASANLININKKKELMDDEDDEDRDKDRDVIHGKPIINIAGLKIITNAKEIMRIVSESEKKRNENLRSTEWLPLEIFRQKVREAKIVSSAHYHKEYKNHPNWPSDPDEIYKVKWKGWNDFLGKETKEYLPLEIFRQEVEDTEIISRRQYYKEYKKHSGWPSNPNIAYKKNWKGWHDLLGKEKKEWLLFDVLKQQVRASGIISAEKYQKEYKNHSDWPSNPNIVYTEWKSWDDFLGKV